MPGKNPEVSNEVCRDFKVYSLGNRQHNINEGGRRLGRATQNRLDPQPIYEIDDRIPDSHTMNAADILRLVDSNENLDDNKKDALIELLQKYARFLTS
jgi:hypothetical protein